ncbi:MAG: chemotaxis protein CheR [Chromatiaceae bacterium]|nr:chemotaxis protein CheR [Chromatiaceae bacterium]
MIPEADLIAFLQWALPRLGLRWAGFRRVRGTVCKRLCRRLGELGLRSLAPYRIRLETDPGEWAELDALCRISVSRFYRDRAVWQALEQEILPRLTAQARARGADRLRCWSAGCASGEEPYTLALLFALGAPGPRPLPPEILATDADPRLLARARRACYPPSSLRELPERWRGAFQPCAGERCLRSEHRGAVRFLVQDIRREQPADGFDLILCRNLAFTYFAAPLQARIAQRLAECLVAGGDLVLGTHESLPEPPPATLVPQRPWLWVRERD